MTFLKTGMGWNFPPYELGERIMGEILTLVLAGKVKPVVGQVIGFEEIPSAIDAMARRETLGRTVALITK